MDPDEQQAWLRVLEVQELLQRHFPELVLVGGTAAAIHGRHRYSLDGDHVLADLQTRFPEIMDRLEAIAGWKTARKQYPVLILGQLEGVETGIRQLRRSAPLETEVVRGIRIPTLAEMARVKGWLVVTRNATRDYVDFCALANMLGDRLADAVRPMDELYPQDTGETVTRQLCKQLAEPKPYDLDDCDLSQYRGIQPPWNDWHRVKDYCRLYSQIIAERILGL